MLDYIKNKFLMYLAFWAKNPVSFIYMLGIARILPYQAAIMQSVVDNKRTIIKSGHGAGKTFIMALVAMWWLCTHWLRGEGCSVVVTSPSAANLTTVFMAQLSKCVDLLPAYFRDHFEITAEAIYETEDSKGWRLDLRTARKDNPDSLQGQHNVLFLIDEWSGVPIEIYRVIEGAMSDEGSRILAIGNPTKRSGWGFDAFGKNKKLWALFTIDCSIYTSDKEFKTEWYDIFDTKHEDFNNGRVDQKEIDKYLDLAQGDIDNFEYRIRVRGEFPDSGTNQFISLTSVKACFQQGEYKELDRANVLAIDPATSGGDDIAQLHRNGRNIKSIKSWQEPDTRKIAYQIRDWLNNEGSDYHFKYLIIDSIGDGKGVYDSLAEMKRSGDLKNVDMVLQYKSSYESPDKEQYDRLRDYTYSQLKRWFINEKPHFPKQYTKECEELQDELCSLTSDFTSLGKVKLDSKKDLKKRGIKSPNIADALSMSFFMPDALPPQEKEDRYKRRRRKRMEAKGLNWMAV